MLDIVLTHAPLIIITLGALIILTLLWALYTEIRLRRFMRGKNAKSLEETITKAVRQSEDLQAAHRNTQVTLKQLDERVRGAARGIATIRFNAFGGRGESGAQSFATAIISEDGEGAVLSSMHTREQTRVFAKPLKQFRSEHELTDEEGEAVAQARAHLDKTPDEQEKGE